MSHNSFSSVLITGATSKLGVELVKLLQHCSKKFILTGRNQEVLAKIKNECEVDCDILPCDLTERKELEMLLTLVEKECPDLVINSAGLGFYGEVLDHPLRDHLDVISTNCSALVSITYSAVKALKNQKKMGTILNVSSAADLFAYPSFSIYAASKAFVTSFSKSIDEELKPFGIRVLNSVPGPITTDFRVRASKGHYTQMQEGISPKEAAEAIIFQIENQIKEHVFPKKIRIGRKFLNMFFSSRYIYRFLAKGIKKRISKD